jgi:hypothetical protein
MHLDPRLNQGHVDVAMLSGDLRTIALRIWSGRTRDQVIRVLLQPTAPEPEPEVATPAPVVKRGRRKTARGG